MIGVEQATLDACLREAQRERVVITRGGIPVALIVGIEGMDEEQVRLGSSDAFWKLVAERRREEVLDRDALEQEIDRRGSK
jgi:antitoxin (DNA-binding transcriptional repressor) of toxin-antitoxin stability system